MTPNAAALMDIVLEASASGRGGLEGVFLAGSGSLRPHTVLTLRPRFCLGPGLAQLSSKQSTSESIHPQTWSSPSSTPEKRHTEEWRRSPQPKRAGPQGHLPSVIHCDWKLQNLAMLARICGKDEYERVMKQWICDGGWQWWAGGRWITVWHHQQGDLWYDVVTRQHCDSRYETMRSEMSDCLCLKKKM